MVTTMSKQARWIVILLGGLAIAVVVGLILTQAPKPHLPPSRPPLTTIRIGITPYQDTALPVVADSFGWYKDAGLRVEFVPLSWGDVMLALSSKSIDASIYTINAFQAPYASSVKGSTKPVFYAPIYVFKGTALMVHREAGINIVGDTSKLNAAERDERVATVVRQLRGKRIAVTKGTEYEQVALAALAKAGLDPTRDVVMVHASVEDALAAFLSGDVDAFGAGLTERIQATKRGGVELLVAADVGPPSIDGIVTTEKFASEHSAELDAFLRIWFRTIAFMEQDLRGNSRYVTEYLKGKASTVYSPEEYAIAWTFNVFPKTPADAAALFNNSQSPFYWKSVWDYNNRFLIDQKQISAPVPTSAYLGDQTLRRLAAPQ